MTVSFLEWDYSSQGYMVLFPQGWSLRAGQVPLCLHVTVLGVCFPVNFSSLVSMSVLSRRFKVSSFNQVLVAYKSLDKVSCQQLLADKPFLFMHQ